MLLVSDYDLRIEPHPFSENEFNSWHPLAVEIKKTGIELKLPQPEELSHT